MKWNNSSIGTMTDVVASGNGFQAAGVRNELSSPTMTNVRASATGGFSNYGVSNQFSAPTMVNVTASAADVGDPTTAYGIYNEDSDILVRDSSISGTTGSILHAGPSTSTSRIVNSHCSSRRRLQRFGIRVHVPEGVFLGPGEHFAANEAGCGFP